MYTHAVGGNTFELDTRDIKQELEGVPINHPEVIKHIGEMIDDAIRELSNRNP